MAAKTKHPLGLGDRVARSWNDTQGTVVWPCADPTVKGVRAQVVWDGDAYTSRPLTSDVALVSKAAA